VPQGQGGYELDTGVFYGVLSDLIATGWIEREPVGQNLAVRLFRLSAHAREDRRFKELVNLEIVATE
jgi:hypothetical protein